MKSRDTVEDLSTSSAGNLGVTGPVEFAPISALSPAPPAVADPQPAAAESLLTIEAAAVRLSTSSTALRARCRRHARRVGREVLARLGAGVTAYKFGASWRVRIDPP